MGEFGTGLRAHLEGSRRRDVYDRPLSEVTADAEKVVTVLEAERLRLEALAAELAGKELVLAGKELELAQREADLHAKQEQMALNLAQALIQTAKAMDAEEPPDELAAYRARRYGS